MADSVSWSIDVVPFHSFKLNYDLLRFINLTVVGILAEVMLQWAYMGWSPNPGPSGSIQYQPDSDPGFWERRSLHVRADTEETTSPGGCGASSLLLGTTESRISCCSVTCVSSRATFKFRFSIVSKISANFREMNSLSQLSRSLSNELN